MGARDGSINTRRDSSASSFSTLTSTLLKYPRFRTPSKANPTVSSANVPLRLNFHAWFALEQRSFMTRMVCLNLLLGSFPDEAVIYDDGDCCVEGCCMGTHLRSSRSTRVQSPLWQNCSLFVFLVILVLLALFATPISSAGGAPPLF